MSRDHVDRIRKVSPPPWRASFSGVLIFLTAILDVPAQDIHRWDDPALIALDRIGATVRRVSSRRRSRRAGLCRLRGDQIDDRSLAILSEVKGDWARDQRAIHGRGHRGLSRLTNLNGLSPSSEA